MDLFVGLDVSVRTTSVCIVDAAGRILKESKVETEPDAIGALLHSISDHYKRVGLEAGPLSQWLYSGLAAAGYPVICVETRHMKAALSAQINKTDRNDARGIAQMMRVGLYKPVHVKTIRSQEIRILLTARRFVQTKIVDAENNLRGLLRNFGLKVGIVTRLKFEQRILDLLKQSPHLRVTIEPLLEIRRVLREQDQRLHKAMEQMAEADEVCQLLMTAPGVGSMVALSFHAGVDEPARFARSRSVPAHFGLTPTRYQSGEIDRGRGISKCGDPGIRWALVEAAGVLLRISKKSSLLREWGSKWPSAEGCPRRSWQWPGAWRRSCTGCGSTTYLIAGRRPPEPGFEFRAAPRIEVPCRDGWVGHLEEALNARSSGQFARKIERPLRPTRS